MSDEQLHDMALQINAHLNQLQAHLSVLDFALQVTMARQLASEPQDISDQIKIHMQALPVQTPPGRFTSEALQSMSNEVSKLLAKFMASVAEREKSMRAAR